MNKNIITGLIIIIIILIGGFVFYWQRQSQIWSPELPQLIPQVPTTPVIPASELPATQSTETSALVPTEVATSMPTEVSAPSVKKYTFQEVAQHNKSDDCWMVINGKVYDVTNFISRHPTQDILLGCGKDATILFEQRRTLEGEIIGSGKPHSPRSRQLLKEFYIGDLVQ